MASMLFREAPVGMTLEELRDRIAVVAKKLNIERAEGRVRGFATAYVSEVMIDARPGVPDSFLVQYSDHDEEAPKRVAVVLKGIESLRGCRGHGDPYLA